MNRAKHTFLTFILIGCIFTSCETEQNTDVSENPPLSNLVADAGEERVTLRWTPPDEEVKAYVISYLQGEKYILVQNTSDTINQYVVDNLEAEITHTFSVSWLDQRLDTSEPSEISATPTKIVWYPSDGPTRFNTQSEIDALQDSITHFPGELIIGTDADTNDISDLSKFSRVREIRGRLIIQRSPLLTNLRGFNSLESIGTDENGELVIRQMSGLTTLDGLQSLKEVKRRVGIRENPALTSLIGLNHLETIGENTLTIGACDIDGYGNPLLTDFCALNTIVTAIGIETLVSGSSCIQNETDFNPSFQDILDGNCAKN